MAPRVGLNMWLSQVHHVEGLGYVKSKVSLGHFKLIESK